MPNFERLAGSLWAAWDDTNLLLTSNGHGSEDPYWHVTVQGADLPDLLAFIHRRKASAASAAAPPALAQAAARIEQAATAAPVLPANRALAEHTNKALDALHDHPGPFQTEAVVRVLHRRIAELEACCVTLGDSLSREVERGRQLERQISSVESHIEGENGLTALTNGMVEALDSLQTSVEGLRGAGAAAAPAALDELRGWVKDEVGAALRRHAGAMHEAIARSARDTLALVQQALQPRPGLLERLALAAATVVRPPFQRPTAPAPAPPVSPGKLQELARAAVEATGAVRP